VVWGGGGGGGHLQVLEVLTKIFKRKVDDAWKLYNILRYFNYRVDHKLHHFRSIIYILQSVHKRRYLRDQSSSTGAVLECCRGNKAHLPLALKLRWGMTS